MMMLVVVMMAGLSANAAVCLWGYSGRMTFGGAYQTGAVCELYLITAEGSYLLETRTTLAAPPAQTGALASGYENQPAAYGQLIQGTTLDALAQVYMIAYNASGDYYQVSAAKPLTGLTDSTTSTVGFEFTWTTGTLANLVYGTDGKVIDNEFNRAILGSWIPKAGWSVVPEPTSMALLALGAAAIGLRRRFRK